MKRPIAPASNSLKPMKWCLILFSLLLFFQVGRAEEGVLVRGGCSPERSPTLQKLPALLGAAITFCDGGDSAKGEVRLQFPDSLLDKVDFFSAGYPDGRAVRIELRNSGGLSIPIHANGKGDQWVPLQVTVPDNWRRGNTLELRLSDSSRELTGWGGLGYREHSLSLYKPNNYFLFSLKAVCVSLLLFLPGLWWNDRSSLRLPIGFVPIPGIAVLALSGLAFWTLSSGVGTAIQWLLYVCYSLAAIDLARRVIGRLAMNRRLLVRDQTSELRVAVLVTVLTFLQALVTGVTPLPMAQEFAAEGNMPGRMIASPPDHLIPYQTAEYFYHRYDGIEHNNEYFGIWNVTSRGPLVSLEINSLFRVFRVDLDKTEHLPIDRSHWPLAFAGEDIARIIGWELNALIILGAFQLLHALGAGRREKILALVWLALSPVVAINTVFLWPKLLAGYFILLALAALIKRRPGIAGFLTALAWLSHPVAALMLPALCLFIFCMPGFRGGMFPNVQKRLALFIPFLLALSIAMAPWLIYKASLGYQDAFLGYVVGGGNGFTRAENIQSWILVRLSNFWLTLSPAAYFYSQYMHSWLYGPIGDMLRWSVQYAKSLPGHLGFSCFLIAYLAFFSGQPNTVLQNVKWSVLTGGFLAMIVFWGFSADALGRASLEPLSVLLVIYAAASKSPALRYLPLLLPALAIENQWLTWSGFLYAPGFKKSMLTYDALGCLLCNSGVCALLLMIGWWSSKPHGRKNTEIAERQGVLGNVNALAMRETG
jgi:hypothetical protein